MWFKRKNNIPEEDEFMIEHYPLTGLYTVKYKNGWLKTQYHTGIVRIQTFFDVVDFYKTQEEARKAISLFKEQKLKEGMKIVEIVK